MWLVTWSGVMALMEKMVVMVKMVVMAKMV